MTAHLEGGQRRHGEADDLDTAVVMPLRLKVLMFAGVAPRRGASTVPGDVEEEQTLQLQVLDFGCEVRPVTHHSDVLGEVFGAPAQKV